MGEPAGEAGGERLDEELAELDAVLGVGRLPLHDPDENPLLAGPAGPEDLAAGVGQRRVPRDQDRSGRAGGRASPGDQAQAVRVDVDDLRRHRACSGMSVPIGWRMPW